MENLIYVVLMYLNMINKYAYWAGPNITPYFMPIIF